jgi:catechol 2,3-dioxygenase-like lactoylglutathione lyase family enzyme
MAAEMEIDHLDLVVRDLEASLDFYGEAGQISVREAQSDGPVDRYRIGLHHLAIGVDSRDVVDERAGWLRSAGAEIEGGPREYDYAPGYYAVFFRDPSGIKLEIVHSPG